MLLFNGNITRLCTGTAGRVSTHGRKKFDIFTTFVLVFTGLPEFLHFGFPTNTDN